MAMYSVFIGDYFIKSYGNASAATFVQKNLTDFFESEKLPYVVSVKREVV